jgi:F-type H+-transporting ATPase subunit b
MRMRITTVSLILGFLVALMPVMAGATPEPVDTVVPALQEAPSQAPDSQGIHGDSVTALESDALAESYDANAKKKAGLPQFDPSTFASQVFWLILSFGLMYVFFAKKTIPDIANILKRRSAHIEHDIATAQKLRESAEEAKARFERAVSEAQQKSTSIFLKADQDVKVKVTSALEEFKGRSLLRLKDTEDFIDKSKKDAMESIHQVAAEVASMAAEKIVGISTDIDQAKNVVRSINKRAA